MKGVFVSAVLGLVSLALVNLCSTYTGVFLPVSRLSVCVSAFLGVPGVTLLVLLNTFL